MVLLVCMVPMVVVGIFFQKGFVHLLCCTHCSEKNHTLFEPWESLFPQVLEHWVAPPGILRAKTFHHDCIEGVLLL